MKNNELLKTAITEQYKELCDKITLQILEKLEGYIVMKDKNHQYITFYELEYMRRQLDETRNKEHEKEMAIIGKVISQILERTEK